MQALQSMARNYFTLSVLYGFFCFLSLHPQGALCGNLTCNPSSRRLESVQELVHRSEVVVEGKLQEDGQESAIYAQQTMDKVNKTKPEMMNDQIDEVLIPVPNRTSDLKPHHVRVRVHQVWEIKAGGLEKDSIVSLLWDSGDNCFTLRADTRYMFFMEPTNDTSVFAAAFPPVETRRAVRNDVSKVLCQGCAEPKLKQMRSKTVDEGKKTAMTCELEAGNPQPNFKWYKNGIEITKKNKPKNTKIKKKKGGRVSELQFRKPAEPDTAVYSCEAVNNLGKISTSGNLTVIKAATSTTPSVRTSSHVTPCNESEKSYCVNGGDCFTLEVTTGTTKKLCRCPRDYTGDRCQDRVASRVISPKQAEELYQKRVLTITGICIALLVVGIMCVVAYCKTKKQRQKLHDRLRQSLRERNAMASMANGQQIPPQHPPPENIQLVNQYISKTAPAKHVIEKETETSFSPSKYTSSAHQSTTVTHTSSQSWMNSKPENIVSESRSALVMSSVEGSRQGTPSHRGRLNATGGTRDLGVYLKGTRETPDSSRDSPYSERYVSAMTTPTHLSHQELLSPVTPSSPPSEMSAPLSSLATSVPSVAVSPIVDEDRPLLFMTPPRLREKQKACCGSSNGGHSHNHNHVSGAPGAHQCSKRNSAHYNHGQDPSPPPSPLHILEDDEYESTQEYEAAIAAVPAGLSAAAAAVTCPPSPIPSKKLPGSRHSSATVTATKRTKPNGIAVGADMVARQVEEEPISMAPLPAAAVTAASESSSEESSSSDESETEDERVGEDTPFLSIQNPAVVGPEMPAPLALRPVDGSRTNPALRLSPQEDLQVRLSSVMTNQDPIAV